jgi:threonine dehydrogenase-like Zn-dependent dehydrogenase
MGTMHVVRDLCQDVPGITIYAGDLSRERLELLTRTAAPLAQSRGLQFVPYRPDQSPAEGPFDYVVLMVPSAPLVAQAVDQAAPEAIINIFAGIPATVHHPIDLDAYLGKQLYFIGTSGSRLEDMAIVLDKAVAGQLDTNLSVAAVTGLDGAIEGMRAVEQQEIPGKIVVYPSCRGLGLTSLSDLAGTAPEAAARLEDGVWTRAAEEKLLEQYGLNPERVR